MTAEQCRIIAEVTFFLQILLMHFGLFNYIKFSFSYRKLSMWKLKAENGVTKHRISRAPVCPDLLLRICLFMVGLNVSVVVLLLNYTQ
jgi:uncharacterized membrane protein